MRKIIFGIIVLVGLSAQAQLKGTWTGYGQWTFKGEGDGVRCSRMTMTWSENDREIAIEKGYFDCDLVAMHLERTSWSIQSGQLLDQNSQIVGSYDQKHFEVTMKNPDDTVQIHLQVDRSDSHYDYQETWFNTAEKIYVIKGRFFNMGILEKSQNLIKSIPDQNTQFVFSQTR